MVKINPWVQLRGMERVFSQETNISDLLQFLSDIDPQPWISLVGFVPASITREASRANNADLYLSSGDQAAVVEVKLGHEMSKEQQVNYEDHKDNARLFLAGLASDEDRVFNDSALWSFISLGNLLSLWTDSNDEVARTIAKAAAEIVGTWEKTIKGAIDGRNSKDPLFVGNLEQKFLARVVTRHIANELKRAGYRAYAGVSSGGGKPLIQAWTSTRVQGKDRDFIAEIRWEDRAPGGVLRFGIDFESGDPGEEENEEVRRAEFELAKNMDEFLQFERLKGFLEAEDKQLAVPLSRQGKKRPEARGDWEQIIKFGFNGVPKINGRKPSRKQIQPPYFGDGALRFQAIADIDFTQATVDDLVQLLEKTLTYLQMNEPEYSR